MRLQTERAWDTPARSEIGQRLHACHTVTSCTRAIASQGRKKASEKTFEKVNFMHVPLTLNWLLHNHCSTPLFCLSFCVWLCCGCVSGGRPSESRSTGTERQTDRDRHRPSRSRRQQTTTQTNRQQPCWK